MFSFTRSAVALAAALLWSCQPEIGDSCSNAGDCSVQEQRTCDTTFPGGYCTVLGCSAGTCPGEAVCIGYQSVLSVAPECASLQARPRLQRTVCLLSCTKDSDCRGGDYACVDMAVRNPWGALVVDRGASGKVCALRPPPDPVGETAVCSSEPVTFPPVVPPSALDGGAENDGGAP